MIIGCPGSGKTTFAEKLNKITGLPLYHLDAIWHKPDKTHIAREDFDKRIVEIFATPQWIIDGNYQRTMEMRLQQCYTVFLFDLPTEVCLQGATERLGKDRYDLPWMETALSADFKKSIEEFSLANLPKIYALLEQYGPGKQVIIFKSREEADDYWKKREKQRCKWCNLKNPRYVEYHDCEWGVPNFDDQYLYEMLILESFQAGLSWECVLNKREHFRKAYEGFDIDKVILFDDAKIAELMGNKDIIRNRRKITASIQNSKIFKTIVSEYGSFYNYLRSFAGDEIIYETDKTRSHLSDAISKDLQKRGMTFVGSTIIYSYLQAIGVIYSHDKDCYLYKSCQS